MIILLLLDFEIGYSEKCLVSEGEGVLLTMVLEGSTGCDVTEICLGTGGKLKERDEEKLLVNSSRILLYTRQPGNEMNYRVKHLPYEKNACMMLMMGCEVYSSGDYRITLDKGIDFGNVSHIWLKDLFLDQKVDLKKEGYRFVSGMTDPPMRFQVTIELI